MKRANTVKSGNLAGLVRTGIYTATIEGIDLIDPSKKESVLFPSFLWRFRIAGSDHDGRYARGLTPRTLHRLKKSANLGRLVEWLDVLHGTPITDQVVKKYSVQEVPVETLRSKYVNKTVKIRITVKYRFEGAVDYRVTSVKEVIK